jgi:hypothetical protein
MIGTMNGSSISKFGQSAQTAQPALRGTSDVEKPSSRDAKVILEIASQVESDGAGENLPATEIDCSLDSDQVIEALRAENEELRRRLAGLEGIQTDAGTKGEDWGEQDREFTRIMEEKTDVIRELHIKIQALQAAVPDPDQPAAQTPREADLFALSDELERERNQLKEDEKSLMLQMRSMEVQMSRERAELARQRTDIERLHIRMQDELELASREASLRERLQPLMRQHQVMIRNGSCEPPSRGGKELAPAENAQPAPATTSGLFRRLFGAGQ